jgi:aminoglycoside phosphotransferase (APT) family kinase protein
MDRPVLHGVTAPVRPGEEIDATALAAWLGQPVEIEQFPDGHSNLVYLVRTPEKEFVLRKPPLGPVAPKAHDMAREFRVLQTVHPHFPEAPEVFRLCEDPSVIGSTFFLMERRNGFVLRNEAPSRRTSEAFIDCLVRLHAVDVALPEIAALGKPDGFVLRQVRGWSDRWQRAKTEEIPEMDRVLGYLQNEIPPVSGPPTIVHNDYKLDNVMLSPEGDRIEAVLDWEMATLGDPLSDLGLSLCYWQSGPHGPVQRDGFVLRYAQKTGRDLTHLGYHEVLGIFKLAVILQQIYFLYPRGQTQDERFRHLDERVRALVEWAAGKVGRA